MTKRSPWPRFLPFLCLFLSQEPNDSNICFLLSLIYFLWPESAYTTTPEPQIDKKNCFKSWKCDKKISLTPIFDSRCSADIENGDETCVKTALTILLGYQCASKSPFRAAKEPSHFSLAQNPSPSQNHAQGLRRAKRRRRSEMHTGKRNKNCERRVLRHIFRTHHPERCFSLPPSTCWRPFFTRQAKPWTTKSRASSESKTVAKPNLTRKTEAFYTLKSRKRTCFGLSNHGCTYLGPFSSIFAVRTAILARRPHANPL